jgi:hypothetical protein
MGGWGEAWTSVWNSEEGEIKKMLFGYFFCQPGGHASDDGSSQTPRRFGILHCCSKAKRFHGIGGESHKDGASIFLTGVRAEFEREDGTVETANALLDAKFVLNQLSRTEVGAMIEAM